MMTTVSRAFHLSLLPTTLLTSTCFGFVLIFALVIMPGLGSFTDDGMYLQSFQAIDRVIQNKQPVFLIVWIGAMLSVFTALGLGFGELQGDEKIRLVVASLLYLSGFVSTVAVNIPLNNRIQELTNFAEMEPHVKTMERSLFERKWCRWNWFRTVVMGLACFDFASLLMLTKS